MLHRSHDSSVSIGSTLYAVPASIQYSVLAVAGLFFSSPNFWGPPGLYSVYGTYFLRRVKSPEPEAGNLLPLSAQTRTVWSYISHPHPP